MPIVKPANRYAPDRRALYLFKVVMTLYVNLGQKDESPGRLDQGVLLLCGKFSILVLLPYDEEDAFFMQILNSYHELASYLVVGSVIHYGARERT